MITLNLKITRMNSRFLCAYCAVRVKNKYEEQDWLSPIFLGLNFL